MGDPISIPATLEGGEAITFQIQRMSAEEAAGIMGRVKARANYYEVLSREIKAQDAIPLHERDAIKYMGLLEKREQVLLELSKAMAPMFAKITVPDVAALNRITEEKKNVPVIWTVMEQYFAAIFPTEADRKKS